MPKDDGTDPAQGNCPPSAWLAGEGWPFDVILDSTRDKVAQAYGVQSFPSFVVVGGDGTVLTRASGALAPDQLDTLVEIAAGSA